MHLTALRALGRRRAGQPEAGRRGLRGAGHRRASRTSCRRTPTCCAPTRSSSATPATRPSACPRSPSSLRGMVNVVVHVEALPCELHSGMFGGPAPDALAALVAMLGVAARRRRQHHDRGPRQHPDLARGAVRPGRLPQRRRAHRRRVSLLGAGTVSDMLWARPALTILGIDCPPVVGSTAAIVPARQRPAEPPDPARHRAGRRHGGRLTEHLRAAAPVGRHGRAWRPRRRAARSGPSTDGPAYAAMRAAMKRGLRHATGAARAGRLDPAVQRLRRDLPRRRADADGRRGAARADPRTERERATPARSSALALAEALFLQRYGAALT